MKKFTKTMALLLIGGLTLVTSCVSEDISPEVENLRQAQVNYLNSKAAMEQAKADNQTAQTAKIQAETALIQLKVEYQQAVMQAKADAEIAAMAAAVAQAEADVAAAQARAAQAEADLQQALDNLAAQVNDTAKEYLAMYQNTMSQANTKLEAIIGLEQDLVRFNAYVDAQGNVVDFESAAAAIEAQIAEDEATIAALEATITRLEGLNTDAASVEAELMDVQAELDEVFGARATAELEAQRAYNEWVPVNTAYAEAGNATITIASGEENIAMQEENIAALEEDIAALEAQLAPFEAELALVDEPYFTAEAEAIALLETWIQAQAELDAADINNAPGDQVYDDALAARDAAQTAFEDFAGTSYPGTAKEIKNDFEEDFSFTTGSGAVVQYGIFFQRNNADPSVEFGEAVIAYTNVVFDYDFYSIKNELNNLGITLENAQATLEGYQTTLATAEASLAGALADMEVADFAELETLYLEATEDYQAKVMVANELNAEVYTLITLRSTLENYLGGQPEYIKNQIASTESQIEFLQNDIEDAEAALVNNEISAEEWAATIVRTQEKIERLTVEYDALVALANDFLEQFNEVVED